jgi:hypothetical protein
MSYELIAILITAAFQSALLIVAIVLLYRIGIKQEADDAALFLQGRNIQTLLHEMRESLRQS